MKVSMINCLTMILLLCSFTISYGQNNTENSESTAVTGLPLPAIQDNSLNDSTATEILKPIHLNKSNNDTIQQPVETDELLPLEEFTIAGEPRYTIDASLPRKVNKIKPFSTAIVGGTYVGILGGLHIYQLNTIWNKTRTFRFIEDGNQDFYSDKAGHFWGAYFISYCSTEALIGSGFSYNNAILYGGLMGFGYQLYIEIMDGFGENWGFSTSDFIGDIAGFGFYLAQHYFPFLQNFTPKATYFPARWYNEKPRLEASSFIDDYSSWTWWMSVNIFNLLPKTWQKYYPSWLEIAFGYSVRDLHYENGTYYGDKKFIISLDYNLARLIPNTTNFLNWLRQCFNYFKFPAPAIEFGDTVKFNLFYPFKISTGNISF